MVPWIFCGVDEPFEMEHKMIGDESWQFVPAFVLVPDEPP